MPDAVNNSRAGGAMRNGPILARLIQRARHKIAHLPGDQREEEVPRAVSEMRAVIHMTENAANTIMAAAEEIARVDLADRRRAKATISGACDRIFEACVFQDITSQRINKVLRTLNFVHRRISALHAAWGSMTEVGEPTGTVPSGAHGLLAGPALDGEGLDQMQVDKFVESQRGV